MTFSMKPFLVSFTSVSWPNSIFYSFQITTELLWIQHSRYPCSCLPRFWLQTWVPLACQLLSRQHRAGRGWKRQSGAKLQRVSKFDLNIKIEDFICNGITYLVTCWWWMQKPVWQETVSYSMHGASPNHQALGWTWFLELELFFRIQRLYTEEFCCQLIPRISTLCHCIAPPEGWGSGEASMEFQASSVEHEEGSHLESKSSNTQRWSEEPPQFAPAGLHFSSLLLIPATFRLRCH